MRGSLRCGRLLRRHVRQSQTLDWGPSGRVVIVDGGSLWLVSVLGVMEVVASDLCCCCCRRRSHVCYYRRCRCCCWWWWCLLCCCLFLPVCDQRCCCCCCLNPPSCCRFRFCSSCHRRHCHRIPISPLSLPALLPQLAATWRESFPKRRPRFCPTAKSG